MRRERRQPFPDVVIAADGSIAPGSKLSFDLRNLKSDQEQRDNFVRTRTLETDKFPLAELVRPRLPCSGDDSDARTDGL